MDDHELNLASLPGPSSEHVKGDLKKRGLSNFALCDGAVAYSTFTCKKGVK